MPVTYTGHPGCAQITLDEPARRNALSPIMIDQLRDSLHRAAEDDSVRSVILTHTGSTFCSGADLAAAKSTGVEHTAGAFLAALRDVIAHPKPVIGAVNGNVRAGGVGLVAACDIVYASDKSTFGTTETKIGVAPAMIALTLLPRLRSRAASRHLLLGDVFGAQEALDQDLVTSVVRDPQVLARQCADEFLHCSPQGLRETKKLVNHALLRDFDREASAMASLSADLFGSTEAQEGMQAFLEKRAPRWAPQQ